MDKIKKGMEDWEAGSLKKVLDRSPERQEVFETESGIPVKRLYTPLDLEDTDYNDDLGFPGEYPFTRGVYPTMYRGRLWTMRNYAGFGTAEDTNKRFRYLLDQGMVGLSMAFDLPTQLGIRPVLSRGLVGRVHLDALDDGPGAGIDHHDYLILPFKILLFQGLESSGYPLLLVPGRYDDTAIHCQSKRPASLKYLSRGKR